MVRKLDRNPQGSKENNPYFEDFKASDSAEKKEKEPLKTMKVPESTHKKIIALAHIKDEKLYEIVETMATAYSKEKLTNKQKQVFDIMTSDDEE